MWGVEERPLCWFERWIRDERGGGQGVEPQQLTRMELPFSLAPIYRWGNKGSENSLTYPRTHNFHRIQVWLTWVPCPPLLSPHRPLIDFFWSLATVLFAASRIRSSDSLTHSQLRDINTRKEKSLVVCFQPLECGCVSMCLCCFVLEHQLQSKNSPAKRMMPESTQTHMDIEGAPSHAQEQMSPSCSFPQEDRKSSAPRRSWEVGHTGERMGRK